MGGSQQAPDKNFFNSLQIPEHIMIVLICVNPRNLRTKVLSLPFDTPGLSPQVDGNDSDKPIFY